MICYSFIRTVSSERALFISQYKFESAYVRCVRFEIHTGIKAGDGKEEIYVRTVVESIQSCVVCVHEILRRMLMLQPHEFYEWKIEHFAVNTVCEHIISDGSWKD